MDTLLLWIKRGTEKRLKLLVLTILEVIYKPAVQNSAQSNPSLSAQLVQAYWPHSWLFKLMSHTAGFWVILQLLQNLLQKCILHLHLQMHPESASAAASASV